MSYLQFGGRNQNLKSSSLENLKVQSKLTVLSTSTLSELRLINNLSFASDSNIFDINAYRRFFQLKNATEDGASSPIGTFDVSNIIIRSTITSSGLAGEFSDLAIQNQVYYRNIPSTRNLIAFADICSNYLDISGSSNLAVGYNALRDFSGNNNIVIGSSLTGTGASPTVIEASGNDNIVIGSNNTFLNNNASKSIILSNSLSNVNSNSIYLGNKDQSNLYTYSNINNFNGCSLGLDISSSLFIFNNMADYSVVDAEQGILNNMNVKFGALQFYGVQNYIKLDSGVDVTGSRYDWKIFLHSDDDVAQTIGFSKSLVFLSPAGRSYFLRDDGLSADASNATGSVQIAASSFTGQHCVILTNGTTEDVGKIVVSAGTYNNFSLNVVTNGPNINESLPLVEFTTTKNDKRCFGVISTCTKIEKKNGVYTYNQGAWSSQLPSGFLNARTWVNSIGEGAVLVTDANGNFENGDFITTSEDAGYGMKQDDDLLHNYTVAKITEDMDFSVNSRAYNLVLGDVTRRVCLVGCTYHCG